MAFDFPELTTIGALFRFAAVLEQAALEVLKAAAKTSGGDETLARLVVKHERRADELERARKEKLNETVLEPLMDMPNTPYVPSIPADITSQDTPALIAAALDIERKTAAFYGDSIDKAGPVLAEVRRIFARYQKESVKNEKTLAPLIK